MEKNKKLTAEERAEEIASRFYDINDKFDNSGTSPYISRHMSYLCALELAKENKWLFNRGPCSRNDFRGEYWNRVVNHIEDKIKEYEN